MEAREADGIYPDSERAACAFHMARAGVGARESLRASKEPFMPFRETCRVNTSTNSHQGDIGSRLGESSSEKPTSGLAPWPFGLLG